MESDRNQLTELNDAQLAELVKQNNESAFTVLAERHTSFIRSVIRKNLHNNIFLDDGVQNVLIKLYTLLTRGHYSENGQFKNWLGKMAFTQAMDIIKAEGIYFHEEPGEAEQPGSIGEEGYDDDETAYIDGYNTLDPDDRHIVIEHNSRNRSFRKIAEEMHVNTDAVRQAYHRSLEKVRKHVRKMKDKNNFRKHVTKLRIPQLVV